MTITDWLTERLPGGRARAAALPVPPVGFTDGTIALRPWRPSDALDLSALSDDEEIRRWTSVPRDYTAQEAAGRAAFAERERLEGRGVRLALTDAHDAVLLGAADLVLTGDDGRTGRLSFLLGASARGHGHASRAVVLLSGWGFQTLGLRELELRPQVGNAAAIAVAGRTGFVRDADPRAEDADRLRFVLRDAPTG